MELLISIFVGLLIMEAYAWLPKISTWLIERAVQRVHSEQQSRCREEWNAGLDALPNTFIRLVHALSFIGAAHRINADFFEIKVNEIDAAIHEVDHVHSIFVAGLRTTKDNLGKLEIFRQESFKRQKKCIDALLEAPDKKTDLAVQGAVMTVRQLSNALDNGTGRATASLKVCVDSSFERLARVQGLILETSKKRDRVTELLARRPISPGILESMLADLDNDLSTIKNIFADDKWGDDDAFKETVRITTKINEAMSTLRASQQSRALRTQTGPK